MKYWLMLFVFACGTLYAAETAQAELARVQEEYEGLYSQSLDTRERAIRANPELFKLRADILQLEKELAGKLSKDPQVKKDTEKLADLEERIETLKKRIEKEKHSGKH